MIYCAISQQIKTRRKIKKFKKSQKTVMKNTRWVWSLLGREIFIGQNHFLLKMFYHCFLPGMMRRLQANLRKYRRTGNFFGNVSELKKEHHKYLIESANRFPDKLFVVIIDAVNQFHSGLRKYNSSFLSLSTSSRS